MHQPEALKFSKQLAGKTSLTREDVRDQATIAIIASDASRADVSVRELIGSHAEPADWLLSAQLSIQKICVTKQSRAECNSTGEQAEKSVFRNFLTFSRTSPRRFRRRV
jgi:hypothetical protein